MPDRSENPHRSRTIARAPDQRRSSVAGLTLEQLYLVLYVNLIVYFVPERSMDYQVFGQHAVAEWLRRKVG